MAADWISDPALSRDEKLARFAAMRPEFTAGGAPYVASMPSAAVVVEAARSAGQPFGLRRSATQSHSMMMTPGGGQLLHVS